MNTKQKRQEIAALAAAFLVMAIGLLAGCDTALNGPPNRRDSSFTGGNLQIHIGSSRTGARTLLPDHIYVKYTLSFMSAGGAIQPDITIGGDQSSAVADLEPGVWTITAKGHVEIEGQVYEAASGTAEVTVPSSGQVTATITISPSMDGPDGWFNYDITYPVPGLGDPGIENAHLYLYIAGTNDLYDDFDTPEREGRIDLTKVPDGNDLEPDGNSYLAKGRIKLPPGYYRMVVQITNGAHAAGITEIVHIYSNMETPVEYDASDDGLQRIQFKGAIQITGDVKALSALTLNFYTDADHTPASLKYSVPVSLLVDNLGKLAWRLLLRPSATPVTLYPQLIAEYIDWNTPVESQSCPAVEDIKDESRIIEDYLLDLGTKEAVTLTGRVKFTGPGAARLTTNMLYVDLSENLGDHQVYPPQWRSVAVINGSLTGTEEWKGSFEIVVPKDASNGLYAAIDFGPYYHYMPLVKALPRSQDATLHLSADAHANFADEDNTIELLLVTLEGTVTATPPPGWSLFDGTAPNITSQANVGVNLYADAERTVFVAHAEDTTSYTNMATQPLAYQWSIKLPPNTGTAVNLYPVVLVNGLVNTAVAQADDWKRYSGWMRFEPSGTVSYGSSDNTSANLAVSMGSPAPVLAELKAQVSTPNDLPVESWSFAVTAYANAVLSYPIGNMELNAGNWELSNVYLIPGHDVWIDVQITLANGLTIHRTEKKTLPGSITESALVDLGNITFSGAGAGPVVRLCGDGADSEDRFRLSRVQTAGTYTIKAGLPKNDVSPYISRWLGIDPEMVLYDANGNEIARNDDEQLTNRTYTNEASITHPLEANTVYFVGVSDHYRYSGVNSYRFSFEEYTGP